MKTIATCPKCSKFLAFEATGGIEGRGAFRRHFVNVQITSQNCACELTEDDVVIIAESSLKMAKTDEMPVFAGGTIH